LCRGAGKEQIIKYDSAVHAKQVEITLRSLEKRARVSFFRLPRSIVFALVLAMLAPWAVMVVLSLRSRPSSVLPASNGTVSASTRADQRHCKPGPWGNIEYFDIVTQPPDNLISPGFFGEAQPAWVFKGYSKAALYELLASAELTEAQRIAIDRAVEFSAAANQCVLKPSKELILGLSPKARATLYAVLAKFPENNAQRDPFIFRPEQIGEWFGDNSGLEKRTVSLLKGLLYPRADLMLLSDHSTVLSELPEKEERVRLLKVCFRRSAVFPRLRVAADSDLKALTSYWSKGGREMVVGPLLRSLPPAAGGITVDIALLLPPFARERLYTYPLPGPETKGLSRDCHWTALNFFNAPPDDRYSHPDQVRSAIENDYYPVPGSPTFGDLVLFSEPRGNLLHSAVYVADDILFTKNGPHFTSPWMLQTQAEVLAAFPTYGKLDVGYFRAKKF